MNGILIIDKPAGITSHDVVARVRSILKTKRVGHTGTLDPFATGVMVILIGRATRLAQFLDKDEKEYEAVLRFGFETDTGDRMGSPKSKVQSPKSMSLADIENVLPEFLGVIEQKPPMFSAKKVDGKKLYELARKGVEVERKSINVTIHELESLGKPESAGAQKNDFGPRNLDFGLRVVCSAGTYIRTLAEDLGRDLGMGAHLQELRRTRAGKFDLSKAITLEELQNSDAPAQFLVPIEEAVSHLPFIILSADRAAKTLNGLSTRVGDAGFKDGQMVQILNEQGKIIAVGYYSKGEEIVLPKIVLS